MTKEFADVSVVTPALNEEENISKCLSGLINQEVKPKEVIFVNHNSTDDTLKIANSFKPKFKEQGINYLVLTEKKKGIANARNKGWFKASQPIIASVDSDCIPRKDWIKNIDLFFKKNKDTVACTGKVVHYDANPVWKTITDQGNYYGIWTMSFELSNGFLPLVTSNCAIKKEIFHKVGGFDPEIVSINGLDDVDIASRIAHEGKVMYAEKVVVDSSFRRYQDLEKAVNSLYERYIALVKIKKRYKQKRFDIFVADLKEKLGL